MLELQSQLDHLKKKGLYRSLTPLSGLDFCSNDYLGLAKNSFLKNELSEFILNEKYLWPSSSRLIGGTTELHLQTESFLAQFLNRKSALLFGSGYSANVGVLTALCQKEDLIFSDQWNHASLIEGIKNCGAKYLVYNHNDLDQLQDLLKTYKEHKGKKYIVTESVFSMDGTLPDLKKLIALANNNQAFLIVDEAHATGIYGSNGQGRLSDYDYNKDQVISIHTGGKALAAYGAFVGCSPLIKEYLVNTSKHFIYTTALPPFVVFQLLKNTEYIQYNPKLRNQLHNNMEFAKKLAHKTQSSPVLSLAIAGNSAVLKLSQDLMNKNIAVKAIRYPTVARGKERIRITVQASHTNKDLEYLFKNVKDSLGELS